MSHWGITPEQFDEAIQTHKTDESIYSWLTQRVSSDRFKAANDWLVTEKMENLERQDAEEGAQWAK